ARRPSGRWSSATHFGQRIAQPLYVAVGNRRKRTAWNRSPPRQGNERLSGRRKKRRDTSGLIEAIRRARRRKDLPCACRWKIAQNDRRNRRKNRATSRAPTTDERGLIARLTRQT